MTGLLELSARDLLARYASGEASPVDAVDEVAARSSAVDGRLGAFTTLCLERARSEAHASEQAYRRGDPQGPLAGVPLGVKDLFDSEGVRTTYGSPMCADHVPAADAEALTARPCGRRDPRRQDADPRVGVGDLLGQRARWARATTRGRSTASRAARAEARPWRSPRTR